MQFHIVTIFPESMKSYIDTSVIRRAKDDGLVTISFYDPRDFSDDKHRSVDGTPYGGGAGMVMQALPILHTVESVQKQIPSNSKTKIILLSAKGSQYTQEHAARWSKDFDHIILIAGRYEGIDERVRVVLGAEEISVGPYVLTDGELPAMIIVSSIARLVPGVISFGSLEEESHWNSRLEGEEDAFLEYPHYTRPETIEWEGKEYKVPGVLLSGDHKKIEEWRNKS